MKAKRIVMAVTVLVLVLAMACALVSCDLFGGGSGGGDNSPTFLVYVYGSNNSAGIVTGNGRYKKGDTVTLTATVNQGYVFVGWQNDNSKELISTDTVYSFIMGGEDVYIVGIFYDCRQVKLECDSDQGSVTGDDFYDVGSSVTITAIAKIGYIFAGWYDGDKLISSEPTYTFIKDEKYTAYTAKFSVEQVYEKLKLERLDDGTYELVEITDKSITEIVLPSYISHIGTGAFRDCNILVIVTIPDSVRSIGSSAFKGCNTLTSISIPDSVTSIGYSAFEDCSSLTSVTIPNSTKSIGWNAFKNCSGLTSVTIPNSVTSIGESAFKGCSGLTSITLPFVGAKLDGTSYTHFGYIFGASKYDDISEYIPQSLKKVIITSGENIGESAFNGCSGLTSISIPNSVTSIGESAFRGCTGLTSIIIPSSVTNIGESAFNGCTGLTSIIIPSSVKSIGYSAFEGCTGLASITLPFVGAELGGTSYTHFGYIFGAHNDYYNSDYVPESLKEVIITGGKSIGSSAFYKCTGLTSVTIGNGVTSIGSSAFYNCSGLTSVTIGSGVTSIGKNAFDDCSKISEVKYTGTIAQWCAISDLYNITRLKIKLYIGGNEITGNLVIPEGISSIGDYAFFNCASLTSITIPDSVTSIGKSAFYGCENTSVVRYTGTIAQWCAISGLDTLTSLTKIKLYIGGNEIIGDIVIPDGVTSISSSAFNGCSGLTSLTIPDSVTSIGGSAFYACENISEVRYTGTIAQWCAISGLGALTSLTKIKLYIGGNEIIGDIVIPDGVTSIGSYAFYNRSSLASVTIPDSVTSIGSFAFNGCSNISEVKYNGTIEQWLAISGLDNLMRYDFNKKLYIGGNELTELVIPDSVTSIGDYAFYGCSSLTSVTIPDSVTSIGNAAFYDCRSLTSVTIPDSVTSIGNNAFYGCTALTSVTIPDSVTSIGDNAFYGCSKISEVKYNGTIEQWLAISGLSSLMGYGSNKKLFIGGNELTELVIPNSVTSIGGGAFYGCSSLTSVTIPDSVTSIGSSAFDGCRSLTSVTIGSGVTSIGSYAFDGCSNISEVKYNGTIEQWLAISGLGSLMHYSSNKKLYIGGSELAELVIPDSVTSIGNYAFYGCSSFTSVTIPDSVSSIGEYAFYGCGSLTSVTIGSGVTSIGDYAFSDCYALAEVYNLSSLNITKGSRNNGYVAYYARDVYSALLEPSKLTEKDGMILHTDGINVTLIRYIGDAASIIIPDNVTSIGSSAFAYCSNLTSVTIPDNVTSIGSSAFAYCSNLTSVTIPDSVTSIGSSAFYGCSSLTSITLPFVGAKLGGTENTYFGYIFGAFSDHYNPDYVPKSLKEVIITGGESIGPNAFYYCSRLTSVTIGNSVTSIGESAFEDCRSLTSVTIGSGVTSIGKYAFYDCSKISEVKYNDTIEQWLAISGLENLMRYSSNKKLYIGGSELTELVIPDSVTSISNYAFYGCSGLTSITIPNSVISIGKYAFYGCSGLTNVTIPDSVTSIGIGAFYGCSSLTSITLPFVGAVLGGTENTHLGYIFGTSKYSDNADYVPKSLNEIIITGGESIGEYAFRYCSSLTSVTIGSGVTSIGYRAFLDCYALAEIYNLSSMKITKGSTDYGYVAYYAHDIYTSLSEPSKLTEKDGMILHTDGNNVTLVKYIGDEAIVIIPDNITSIGSGAFYGCSSLTSVTIGSGVTSIGSYAFYNCSKISEVIYIGTIEQWLAISGLDNLMRYGFNKKLYIGGNELTELVIPDSVTSIGNYAFYGCSSITSVTIPDGVTSIGNYAFAYCSSLTSVTIPDSVTSIGDYAFYNCSSLTSVTIGSGVTSIGNYAFRGCSSLTSVIIPDSVTSIGNYAFRGCSSLTSVIIPDSVTSIGDHAFYDCSSLTSVTIGSGVTSIGSYAFAYCSNLTSVTIGSGVTSIGSYAFAYCSNLTSVTIPDSVTSIGDHAFYDCSSLTSVTIGSSVTSIGSDAFYNCRSLTSLTIPDSVTYIGSDAFYNCWILTSVTFENTTGWFVSKSYNATSGTNVYVTNPSQNAKYLKDTYYNYYWKRG